MPDDPIAALRNALAVQLWNRGISRRSAREFADEIMALLPRHAAALLSLVGDVHEAIWFDCEDGVDVIHTQIPGAVDLRKPLFVVVPRHAGGDADDPAA